MIPHHGAPRNMSQVPSASRPPYWEQRTGRPQVIEVMEAFMTVNAGHADHSGDPEVFRITTAGSGLSEDQRTRTRRYLISMSIRTLCFLGAVRHAVAVALDPVRRARCSCRTSRL